VFPQYYNPLALVRRILASENLSTRQQWDGSGLDLTMTASRIKISYSAPTNFLASDQWIQIRTALEAHLPLRSLIWRPSSTAAAAPNAATSTPNVDESHVQRVDTLQVELIALDALKDEGSSQIPSSVLERPLVNLYFFACEVLFLSSIIVRFILISCIQSG
jgi:hypothetical protein